MRCERNAKNECGSALGGEKWTETNKRRNATNSRSCTEIEIDSRSKHVIDFLIALPSIKLAKPELESKLRQSEMILKTPFSNRLNEQYKMIY